MALTVEDGTGVAGADSYVTLDEVKAYASSRGYSLPAADADIEKLVVKATDYLESLRRQYKGAKINGQGYLQWPRQQSDGTGVVIDGTQLDVDDIPVELKNAQCQLVIEIQTTDPLPTTDAAAVKSETIDVITTVYAVADGNRAPLPSMSKVKALLEPLFKAATGFGLSTVRV